MKSDSTTIVTRFDRLKESRAENLEMQESRKKASLQGIFLSLHTYVDAQYQQAYILRQSEFFVWKELFRLKGQGTRLELRESCTIR